MGRPPPEDSALHDFGSRKDAKAKQMFFAFLAALREFRELLRLCEKPDREDTVSTKRHKETPDNDISACFLMPLRVLCVFVVTIQTVS